MPKVSVPKKTVAKKVVKKTVAKKVVLDTKLTLAYADNKRSFWVVDGQILNSLVALKTALASMDKSTFAHHVDKEKNDFALWVETVLGDKDCARDLSKAKTLTAAKTALTKHLKKYAI